MQDLKQRATRGGLAKIVAQSATLLLRTGSLMVMARLLTPTDFGLVGMVTAMIGIFAMFRDFGLSAAAVQRSSMTVEQSSTLFWINLLVGVVLCLTIAACAPFVAAFYHEPDLVALTVVLSTGFLFNAAGVQHAALLERQMRFVVLSTIDILSLTVSVAVGIILALRGFGYWALVATSTVTPLVYTLSTWSITRWVPGRPRRGTGMGSMMRFGGSLTAGGLVTYFARNLDKILLGRFWGASALGIYGRGYQLVNIPSDNLNSSIGGVVFAALARLQHDHDRLRAYFTKGYRLLLSLSIPITCVCALFGKDIVNVLLGPKWDAAVPVFRILAPAALGFAIMAPANWLLAACGKAERTLKVALILTPMLAVSYALGLAGGPNGVAVGYSVAMTLCSLPLTAWAVKGTPVHFADLLNSIRPPLVSGVIACLPAYLVHYLCGSLLSPIPRLCLDSATFFSTYFWILLYVMREKKLFVEVARALVNRPSVEEAA